MSVPGEIGSEELRGKIAVVTGAGAGIGREICRRLAAHGATVVPTDKHRGRVEETAGELARRWPGSVGMQALLDIERRQDFDEVFARVEAELGPITVYVWNAALNVPQPLLDHDAELFDRIFYANANNCWYSCAAVARQMRSAGGGSIVSIGSIAPDVVATVREPPYAMAKAAVRALVLALAKAGGPFNIRCNEVVMGLVEGTRFTDERPDRVAESAAEIPLGRVATTSDIADAVAFLVSDRALFISGSILNVSGGLYLRL